MKQEEYMTIQHMLFTMGAVVSECDLTGFIAAIDKADTVGPFTDPTLWMKSQRQMMKIREMAVELRGFQETYRAAANQETER